MRDGLQAALEEGEELHVIDGWEFNEPYEEFKYDQYDWSKFDEDYVPIVLTHGYFTFVSRKDYKRLSKHRWHANIQREKITGRVLKIYARRNTRNGKKTKAVYLHRIVISAGCAVHVDHRLHSSLDNRRENLRATSQAMNNANRLSWVRRTNPGLPRGVVLLKNGLYIGKIQVNGKAYESKRKWKKPGPAHTWYLNRHKEFYGHCDNVSVEKKVPPLVFPPLKKDVVAAHVRDGEHPIPF